MATARRTYFKKLASRWPINLQNTNFASTAGALITFKPYSGLRFRSYMSFRTPPPPLPTPCTLWKVKISKSNLIQRAILDMLKFKLSSEARGELSKGNHIEVEG